MTTIGVSIVTHHCLARGTDSLSTCIKNSIMEEQKSSTGKIPDQGLFGNHMTELDKAFDPGGQSTSEFSAGDDQLSTKVRKQKPSLPVKRYKPYKKGRTKKPNDAPRRALSAYNFFFSEQRELIVEERTRQLRAEPREHSQLNRTTKKAKISFEELAKIVATRWKNISPDELAYYKNKAKEDIVRYKNEMDAYNQKVNPEERPNKAEVKPQRSMSMPPRLPTSGGTDDHQDKVESMPFPSIRRHGSSASFPSSSPTSSQHISQIARPNPSYLAMRNNTMNFAATANTPAVPENAHVVSYDHYYHRSQGPCDHHSLNVVQPFHPGPSSHDFHPHPHTYTLNVDYHPTLPQHHPLYPDFSNRNTSSEMTDTISHQRPAPTPMLGSNNRSNFEPLPAFSPSSLLPHTMGSFPSSSFHQEQSLAIQPPDSFDLAAPTSTWDTNKSVTRADEESSCSLEGSVHRGEGKNDDQEEEDDHSLASPDIFREDINEMMKAGNLSWMEPRQLPPSAPPRSFERVPTERNPSSGTEPADASPDGDNDDNNDSVGHSNLERSTLPPA